MTFKEQYYKIIHNRKTNPLDDSIYGEIHHIWPRSLGGSDDEENLVKLTAQEHYDCHEILPFVYLEEGNQEGYDKMMYAWYQISHTREGLVINAEKYAELKELYATMLSESRKGENNPNYGKKWSDDAKQKMSEVARKSEKHKEASRQNLKKAREASVEARRKPFEIDCIRFERLLDAARHFNVGQMTISRWLNGKRKTDHSCHYIKETEQ